MSTENDAARFGAWRKSSHSNPNNNCVEVAWRKSSYSNPDNQCVEVAVGGAAVGLRDSKNPDGPALTFARPDWSKFLGDVGSAD